MTIQDPIGHRVVTGEGKTDYLIGRAKWLSRRYPRAHILVVCPNLASRRLMSRKLSGHRKIRVCSIHQVLKVDPLIEAYDFLLVDEAHLMDETDFYQLGLYVRNLAKTDVTIACHT